MRLATVLGQVVSTVKDPGLDNYTLLLVREDDETEYVAVDLIGAGAGEVVLVAGGGAARVAAGATRAAPEKDCPADRAVVAIVDTVSRAGTVTYQKA